MGQKKGGRGVCVSLLVVCPYFGGGRVGWGGGETKRGLGLGSV